jgi:hypothetical protein
MRSILFALVLASASPAIAEPLTVHTGETWLFTIEQGEPAHARKVDATAKAARGEVKVSVRSLFGTMMTISGNSPQGYTFQAQLVGVDGKTMNVRACGLPPNNQPALESWPQKAAAVQIGDFKPAKGGRC